MPKLIYCLLTDRICCLTILCFIAVTGGADLVKDGGTVVFSLVLSPGSSWSNETLSITLPSGYSPVCKNATDNATIVLGTEGLTGTYNVTCTVTYTVNSTDAEAGVIPGGEVIATLTDASSPPIDRNITGCTLPNVPVYTGSSVQDVGVALAPGEALYLSGKHSSRSSHNESYHQLYRPVNVYHLTSRAHLQLLIVLNQPCKCAGEVC